VGDGEMRENSAGRMVRATWAGLWRVYKGLENDQFVVMPDHLHAVVKLDGCRESLSDVVRGFKTYTTRRYIEGVRREGWPPFSAHLWQRGFFDHVVRNEKSLDRIRQYILENPARWSRREV
jgi:REP element-mobilizing transposase RayT